MITIDKVLAPEETQQVYQKWKDSQISKCQHCIDAYGIWVVCNKNGVETEFTNLHCMNCEVSNDEQD